MIPPSVPAILVTQDGRTFRGRSFGAIGQAVGEASLGSGMVGYQAMLTDPARAGQIVIATSPHSGILGWTDVDGGAPRIQAAGYVVRDPSPRPSNRDCDRSLDEELVRQGIVGLCQIDTRALVQHLREGGPMLVGIDSTSADAGALLAAITARQA